MRRTVRPPGLGENRFLGTSPNPSAESRSTCPLDAGFRFSGRMSAARAVAETGQLESLTPEWEEAIERVVPAIVSVRMELVHAFEGDGAIASEAVRRQPISKAPEPQKGFHCPAAIENRFYTSYMFFFVRIAATVSLRCMADWLPRRLRAGNCSDESPRRCVGDRNFLCQMVRSHFVLPSPLHCEWAMFVFAQSRSDREYSTSSCARVAKNYPPCRSIVILFTTLASSASTAHAYGAFPVLDLPVQPSSLHRRIPRPASR